MNWQNKSHWCRKSGIGLRRTIAAVCSIVVFGIAVFQGCSTAPGSSVTRDKRIEQPSKPTRTPGFQPPAARALDGGRLDTMPMLVHFEAPKYPENARDAGIEGSVLIEVIIGVDGKVTDAKVIDSDLTPAMEQSALLAAKKLVFRPGIRDGKPVECKIGVPMEFTLN